MKKTRTFIVAELSANHGGNIETAKETIRAAKNAGADAIKLQTYTPDTMTIDSNKDYFIIKKGLWQGRTLYDLYKEAYTPWEWHGELYNYSKSEGLICFSTPFDKKAVDLLEKLNNPIYKISSFEIRDIPLIEHAASKGKPMILSTGIAEIEDIELAIDTCRKAGNNDITLLKCTSAYPAPIEEANIVTILDMKKRFNVKVGISDHTQGFTVPVVATSLGAEMIEKHFIIDNNMGGPDAAFSLNYDEFSLMVKTIRESEKALGNISYQLSANSRESKKYGRSLFVVQDIKKGEIITEENVMSIRPGYGLHPKYYYDILGKRSLADLQKGMPIKLKHIDF